MRESREIPSFLRKQESSAFEWLLQEALDDSLHSPLRGQPSAVQRSQGSLLSGLRRDDEQVGRP